MPPERVQSDDSWRQQVLQRVANSALRIGMPLAQMQQRLAFERLLARLPTDGSWVLKGGFALLVRYGITARPTKDIDLLASAVPAEAMVVLQHAAEGVGEDRFGFVLRAAKPLPGDAAGMVRVFVLSRLSGRDFVSFHVDLVGAEPLAEPPERLVGMDLLGFAGIAPLDFPVFPLTQHLAEKLHAYTQPRTRENSRAKDLVDLVLLPTLTSVDIDQLRIALAVTFDQPGSHPLPSRLPAPPPSWATPFAALSAATPGAPTADLDEAWARAAGFWDPVLAGEATGLRWLTGRQEWQREQS